MVGMEVFRVLSVAKKVAVEETNAGLACEQKLHLWCFI